MKKIWKLALPLVLAITALAVPMPSQAGHIAVGCGQGYECMDVWDPVICPNGRVYSNSCYAAKACQTNCVPYGDTV
ncbi:MAG TPA: hypothetical protein VIW92_13845 [Thermoanaerobaculia bacterium]